MTGYGCASSGLFAIFEEELDMKKLLAGILILGLTGCLRERSGDGGRPIPVRDSVVQAQAANKIALISITNDAKSHPQSLNMGLTFAKFCLDEGYKVAIFFNVKGVNVPTKSMANDASYGKHDPYKTQIVALAAAGVEIHVCPVCMGDLDIKKSDLMKDAFVTTKPKLFANLGSDTMVFTY